MHANQTIVEAGAALQDLQNMVLGDASDSGRGGVHPEIRRKMSTTQHKAANGLMKEVNAFRKTGPAMGSPGVWLRNAIVKATDRNSRPGNAMLGLHFSRAKNLVKGTPP